ncbi:hypothetical protein MSZK_27540 [Mycobacterium sp. shizuoka-1]|nr:hypothetical protein MSZK_27540 [Mycobacterium sp. shizuoka-1]
MGGAASIQVIASAIGTPPAGAGCEDVVVVVVAAADDEVAVRDGVIGVSWVWPA